MSTPPIEVPEEFVVKDPFSMIGLTDKTKVIEFFGLISRIEYAVMLLGFTHPKKDEMSVDWIEFAKSMDGKLTALELTEVTSSVDYLAGNPPLTLLKTVEWVHRGYKGDLSVDTLAILGAKDVRNNLFHGIKYNNPDHARNNELLVAAIVVLTACLRANSELNAYFNT